MSPAQHQAPEDTIAAISTPPGVGAIAVVRLSGPEAVPIAGRVFKGGAALADAIPRTVCRGHVISASAGRIDEVLATVFAAPRSYTGEDMVELSCHGGALPAALVLGSLIEEGARPAAAGEFTKRAFLAGRIDLSQAEAVAEIVAAKSRAGLKAALAQLDGALSGRVRRLRARLVEVLAELEARLDFAEDVEAPVSRTSIESALAAGNRDLDDLMRAAELGRLACEGSRVVIAGRPNVGKSRLLNSLVGKDRAIVTPVPGTTRDTIEEWVELDGVLLTLADTAGLRPTTDVVEAEGVRRTRALVRECQLVLAVLESPEVPGAEDTNLMSELARQAPVIPVVNKIDLGGDREVWSEKLGSLSASWNETPADDEPAGAPAPSRRHKAVAADRDPGAQRPDRAAGARRPEHRPIQPPVFTSALTGEGVGQLKSRIVESLIGRGDAGRIEAGEVLLTNARHIVSLQCASDAMVRVSSGLEEELSEEILAFEVGQALQALGEITGESVTEEVLDTIFSRFCIGK